jgi:hypothetical protein
VPGYACLGPICPSLLVCAHQQVHNFASTFVGFFPRRPQHARAFCCYVCLPLGFVFSISFVWVAMTYLLTPFVGVGLQSHGCCDFVTCVTNVWLVTSSTLFSSARRCSPSGMRIPTFSLRGFIPSSALCGKRICRLWFTSSRTRFLLGSPSWGASSVHFLFPLPLSISLALGAGQM